MMKTFISIVLILLVGIVNAQIQEEIIAPSDLEANDSFGTRVRMHGNYAIISSPTDDDIASNAGALYVYTKNDGSWIEHQKITSSDGNENDFFGTSADIHGDYILVGCPYQISWMGSAYLFKKNSDNAYEQIDKVTDNIYGNLFGKHVSLYGEYAAIGTNGTISLYKINNEDKLEFLKTLLPDSDFEDPLFGNSIEMTNKYLIAGSPQNGSAGFHGGSVYIYEKGENGFELDQKLFNSDSVDYEAFGISVDIHGETAVIGATGSEIFTGKTYIFEKNETWQKSAILRADDENVYSYFGQSVCIYNDLVLIGTMARRAVYLFKYNGSDWIQEMKLTEENLNYSKSYGCSICTNGEVILVGANGADYSGLSSGLAFFYSNFGIVHIKDNLDIPSKFILKQNYPNPFNPTTNIKYEIPNSGNVKISIYDALGNLIYTPVNSFHKAGRYEFVFNASVLSSGSYFYELRSNNMVSVKKMLLIK